MCCVTGSFSALVTSQVFVQRKAHTVCIIVLIIKGNQLLGIIHSLAVVCCKIRFLILSHEEAIIMY